MTELLTSAEMRAIEMAAMDSGAVTGEELMERAGRGAVEAALDLWPDLAHGPTMAVVLCGPGNNGGDGFVVARLLADRGWQVECYLLYATPERLPPDAATNARRWLALGKIGTEAEFWARYAENARPGGVPVPLLDRDCALVVDALFGTGLARALAHDWREFFRHVRGGAPRLRTLSIDIPSGICADSGRMLCDPGERENDFDWDAPADLTATFQTPKRGHYLAAGGHVTGPLHVVDIGLQDFDDAHRADALARLPVQKWRVSLAAPDPERLGKPAHGHKYDHGHALVLAGGPGRGGAARLAARAALRVGAGLVTVGCPPDAMPENAARLDAVMLRGVSGARELADWLAADLRLNTLCLGPGLGLGEREKALVATALASGAPSTDNSLGRATLLDADALTLIAGDEALYDALHRGCILTPHAGEFARLFPDLAERLFAPPVAGPAYSRVDAVLAAAERAGCTVLLKGPDTVIASPEGHAVIHAASGERAVPWLATAGSGDVLAGLIAGLLARGLQPLDAAETAVCLHAACARQVGPGLIAEDLPEALPAVLCALRV